MGLPAAILQGTAPEGAPLLMRQFAGPRQNGPSQVRSSGSGWTWVT
jgi:hypothetical protein